MPLPHSPHQRNQATQNASYIHAILEGVGGDVYRIDKFAFSFVVGFVSTATVVHTVNNSFAGILGLKYTQVSFL